VCFGGIYYLLTQKDFLRKTRDLFRKTGDSREHFNQDRNNRDLVNAKGIKKRWKE